MQKALCLSGGGYRAAIFHLGALLRLHELRELRDLDMISSVSGGSIASARGVNWEFSKRRVGDFQTGYLREHGGLALSTAVAVFCDNLATEPALRSHGIILVSDAGAPFDFVAGQHFFRRLLRYAAVVAIQANLMARSGT